MARPVRISPEEYQQSIGLRADAAGTSGYRKAPSVILMADHGFDAGTAAALPGTGRRRVYRAGNAIRKQADKPANSWSGWRRSILPAIEG